MQPDPVADLPVELAKCDRSQRDLVGILGGPSSDHRLNEIAPSHVVRQSLQDGSVVVGEIEDMNTDDCLQVVGVLDDGKQAIVTVH